MTSKNPRTPPQPLTRHPADIVSYRKPLWRVHRVAGRHPIPWNGLRTFGPAQAMRWDPHPLPVGDHPGIGVSYAAADATTAFAEVFQSRRAITRSADLAVAGWLATRSLSLLDLTGTWALRNGASASLHAAPKTTCRAWAQGICTTWPDIDGLLAPSTMTGRPMVVLFQPSATTFPARPRLARRLDDHAIDPIVELVATELRWMVR